jgi:hypothetical protein
MREKMVSALRAWVVLPGAEVDVLADGEGTSVDVIGGVGSIRIRVNAHATQVCTERGLHVSAARIRKTLAATTLNRLCHARRKMGRPADLCGVTLHRALLLRAFSAHVARSGVTVAVALLPVDLRAVSEVPRLPVIRRCHPGTGPRHSKDTAELCVAYGPLQCPRRVRLLCGADGSCGLPVAVTAGINAAFMRVIKGHSLRHHDTPSAREA